MKIRLKLTCGGCPESYDAFIEGSQKASFHLRLRHGYFTVEVLDAGDELGGEIYSACPSGDGIFEDNERVHYLNEACRAIEAHLHGDKRNLDEEPIYEMDK